MTTSSMLELEV